MYSDYNNVGYDIYPDPDIDDEGCGEEFDEESYKCKKCKDYLSCFYAEKGKS